MSVSVFGWMRSATQMRMIARSGRMHSAPMAPVKVIRWADVSMVSRGNLDGVSTAGKRDIVAYGHPGSQGADRTTAGAAWRVHLLECHRRDDLRRQSASAAR